jgi:FtsZ-binding cell division protein ZapB
MAAAPQEIDALASLEDRIHKAVELVAQLRAETEALRQENENLRGENKALHTSNDAALHEAAEGRAQAEQLGGELQALRAERKYVRGRIEKLLGHLDQLGAG